MMDEPMFKCRIEELTFLGVFILVSFNRDKADFIKFSPDYNDPFADNCEQTITVVEELVAPKKLTGEMKKITQQLADLFTHCRNMMNKVERYVDKASKDGLELTMAPGDFGIKAVCEAAGHRNDEGMVKNLRTVQQNLTANLDALIPKGYTAEVQAELKTLIRDLNDASVAQTLKKNERMELVKNNMGELNNLWLIIDDLMKSGKAIYKEKDKSRLRDYTYAELIKNVQLKRKQEETPETAPATK
jgi:hypothetical protein